MKLNLSLLLSILFFISCGKDVPDDILVIKLEEDRRQGYQSFSGFHAIISDYDGKIITSTVLDSGNEHHIANTNIKEGEKIHLTLVRTYDWMDVQSISANTYMDLSVI